MRDTRRRSYHLMKPKSELPEMHIEALSSFTLDSRSRRAFQRSGRMANTVCLIAIIGAPVVMVVNAIISHSFRMCWSSLVAFLSPLVAVSRQLGPKSSNIVRPPIVSIPGRRRRLTVTRQPAMTVWRSYTWTNHPRHTLLFAIFRSDAKPNELYLTNYT